MTVKPDVNFYYCFIVIEQSTGHGQIKNSVSMYDSLLLLLFLIYIYFLRLMSAFMSSYACSV